MDRTIQDLAWRCLPREFKEEVKKEWRRAYYNDTKVILEYFFGKHNLTSDAEGEEMLMVSRKEVNDLFNRYERCYKETNGKCHDMEVALKASHFFGKMCALIALFGSKCLPDDGDNLSPEPKPAEPKFKVEDQVVWDKRIIAYVDEILNDGDYIIYSRVGNRYTVHESDLAPYTEPKKDHIVQDHEMVDTIIKDGFRDERRLNIAAQMMQGLICVPLIPGCNPNPPAEQLAQTAFRLADAFIAEAEKRKEEKHEKSTRNNMAQYRR